MLNRAFDIVWFTLTATNQHGIHSPSLFQLYEHVIRDDRKFHAFEKLEVYRNQLLRNSEKIDILELGAGSSYGSASSKQIKEVASQQLSSPYQLRVLFRLIEWVGAENIVELGASLGLSSFYLAATSTKNTVTSFEGNPHFVKLIKLQNLRLGFENLHLIEGNFDKTYPEFIQSGPKVDFIFIDGNHREQATIDYFLQSLKIIDEDGIIVLDDIHWSLGMQKAWKKIKAHERVNASIDLYMMGIIFLSPEYKEKRHLNIRPRIWT